MPVGLVFFRYTKFKNPNSSQTTPAPPAFRAAVDQYVRKLVAAVSRGHRGS
jgi:hypothetical protein